MPTTAGSLDLISMIIDRWISFWTIIASLTARVTTNNRVSSASGSQLVTRQMPNASTSRICLCFENVDDDSYRLHPLFMFCKKLTTASFTTFTTFLTSHFSSSLQKGRWLVIHQKQKRRNLQPRRQKTQNTTTNALVVNSVVK